MPILSGTHVRVLALCLSLAVAACSKGPTARPATAAPSAEEIGASDVDAVQALLMHGDAKGAEKLLKPLLRRDPMNARLLLLKESIHGDPKYLLGPVSYPYTVRPGEDFEAIAERLLGNRLKAYQLARYNDVADPASLTSGRTIRVPGSPLEPRAAPVEKPVRSVGAPAPVSRPKPAVAVPAKPAANPAAAQRARAAGLAALNRGAVNDAVAQLRRAKALDPGNAVIARDLQRAERIAATVRARK